MVTFNFSIAKPKTERAKPGRKKGCKLTYKVKRNGASQARFGHRAITTSSNKLKDTPIKQGYHLEDYKRICVYEHYYDDEKLPFYVGSGTIGRAFYLTGSRRCNEYNDKAVDINKIKVKIVAIDIDKKEAVNLEKDLWAKYKRECEGGSLVNTIPGGRGGNNGQKYYSKQIERIDRFGRIIETFNSIREAANKYSIDSSAISKNCLGKQKTVLGYRFRYKQDI